MMDVVDTYRQTAHRGAVRSEASRTAILGATTRLVLERGYDHLTIEGIATEAKVGKQTVYRWWPSKGALVAECMLEGLLLPAEFLPPTTGTLRDDLTAWLRELLGFVTAPANDTLMRSLIAAAIENETVAERLNSTLGTSSALVNRLTLAVAVGELPSSAPVTEISESLVGALILQILTRTHSDPDRAESFVSAVLGPVEPG